MSASLTVRDIDVKDKSWLRREARSNGISMSEFVRRLIREKRTKSESCTRPSEVFARCFGEEHGIEIPITRNYGYRPVSFSEDDCE